MIRLGPAKPGDATLSEILAKRPELTTMPLASVLARVGVDS